MHPIVPSGGGFAPPNIVPVYPPGQEPQQRKVKKAPSIPQSTKPSAPQVTTLLVTESTNNNGTPASLGVIGGKHFLDAHPNSKALQ